MLSYTDVCDLLKIPLLGVIPEAEAVLDSSNAGVPVIYRTGTPPAQAYQDAVSRFLGEDREMLFLEVERLGFVASVKRMFGGRP